VSRQIAALNGKPFEIRFGYAMGGHQAFVTEASTENNERLMGDPSKGHKPKPISVRGYEFEAKDASSGRKTSK
jgi:hypothetical protein